MSARSKELTLSKQSDASKGFLARQEIVRRVEGLFALADQVEERLAKARGQVEKLTPSLLARAFAGQLVPQDPNDEPAVKLLRRIKTSKVAE